MCSELVAQAIRSIVRLMHFIGDSVRYTAVTHVVYEVLGFISAIACVLVDTLTRSLKIKVLFSLISTIKESRLLVEPESFHDNTMFVSPTIMLMFGFGFRKFMLWESPLWVLG